MNKACTGASSAQCGKSSSISNSPTTTKAPKRFHASSEAKQPHGNAGTHVIAGTIIGAEAVFDCEGAFNAEWDFDSEGGFDLAGNDYEGFCGFLPVLGLAVGQPRGSGGVASIAMGSSITKGTSTTQGTGSILQKGFACDGLALAAVSLAGQGVCHG